jgi:hypothetical protein
MSSLEKRLADDDARRRASQDPGDLFFERMAGQVARDYAAAEAARLRARRRWRAGVPIALAAAAALSVMLAARPPKQPHQLADPVVREQIAHELDGEDDDEPELSPDSVVDRLSEPELRVLAARLKDG